jgi:hypothetical protein
MTGGDISAKSTNKIGYAASTGNGQINGGKIHGSTYGLYALDATIGDDTDSTLSITAPEIIGDTYAVYQGAINFYDGVLKGQLGTDSGAYYDRNIKQIATGTAIHVGSETIDGAEYEVKYLEQAHNVARIGSTEYTSIFNAVEAAQENDTIYLLEDNYVFDKIVIGETKNLTIDLDGHTIVTGNQITNNGKLTLMNGNLETETPISYHESNYFLANTPIKNSTVTPDLTLDNVEIHAKFVVDNSKACNLTIKNSKLYSDFDDNSSNRTVHGGGTVTIEDSQIYGHSTTAVELSNANFTVKNSLITQQVNSSNTTVQLTSTNYSIDNSTIDGEYAYALRVNGTSSVGEIKNHSYIKGKLQSNGQLTVTDSEITQESPYEGSIIISYTNSKLSLTNTNIHRTGSNGSRYCSNDNTNAVGGKSILQSHGELIMKDVTMSNSYEGNNTCQNNYIGNSGTATIDGLTITNDDSAANSSARTSYGIVNTGTMTLDNASITLSRSTSYGIYTNGGTLDMNNTTIDVNGTKAYGIYVENGDLTMGTPEPVDSPNYGTGDADVSTTNPSVTAIGTTTGIGIYKNLGRFKYYDGIITGSTWAIPRDKISSDVEHLYEPTFHTDENGRDVCILTWMRE